MYITFGIKWWMAILALAATAVNTICNIILSKNEIERFNEETAVSKQLEYSRFWLTDISRAKGGARLFAAKIYCREAA